MPDETHQRAAGRNSSRRSPISSIPTESSSAHPEYTQQPTSRRNPPVHCLAKLSRRDPAARIVTKSNSRSPDCAHPDEIQQRTTKRNPSARNTSHPHDLQQPTAPCNPGARKRNTARRSLAAGAKMKLSSSHTGESQQCTAGPNFPSRRYLASRILTKRKSPLSCRNQAAHIPTKPRTSRPQVTQQLASQRNPAPRISTKTSSQTKAKPSSARPDATQQLPSRQNSAACVLTKSNRSHPDET